MIDLFTRKYLPKKTEENSQEPLLAAKNTKELRGDTKLVNLTRAAIDASSDEGGWAQLGPVGNFVSKTANDFDPMNYGFSKLNELITAVGLFEIDRREKSIYVRNKRKK